MQRSIDDPVAEAYNEHSTELLAFLKRRVSCPQQAADLRQEVYLRFGQTPPAGRVGNLRAYLYRIAVNLLIDVRRQKTVERQLFDTAASDEEVRCPAPMPEAVVAGAEELRQLRAILQELPPAHRNALIWYRLHDLTLREIGERLGVSESMAGRYVNKALAYCEERLRRTE